VRSAGADELVQGALVRHGADAGMVLAGVNAEDIRVRHRPEEARGGS
jgi:hypothetical protein